MGFFVEDIGELKDRICATCVTSWMGLLRYLLDTDVRNGYKDKLVAGYHLV